MTTYNLKTIYFKENSVSLTFCFPHDVTHQIAGRGFSHQKVFGPSGQVLQVEPNSVGLGQRVEVNRVEPEQVVAGELSESRHIQIFRIWNLQKKILFWSVQAQTSKLFDDLSQRCQRIKRNRLYGIYETNKFWGIIWRKPKNKFAFSIQFLKRLRNVILPNS